MPLHNGSTPPITAGTDRPCSIPNASSRPPAGAGRGAGRGAAGRRDGDLLLLARPARARLQQQPTHAGAALAGPPLGPPGRRARPTGSTRKRCTAARAPSCTRATGRRSSPGSRGAAGYARQGASASSRSPTSCSSASPASFGRASRPPREQDCSISAPGAGTPSPARGSPPGREQLPPISDEPSRRRAVFPPVGDGACSNLGAGCTEPHRAALMIGTSGAYRVVRETRDPNPRPGSSATCSTTGTRSREAPSRTGATSTRGSTRTLKLDGVEAGRTRRPRAHVPAAARRRAESRLEHRRDRRRGGADLRHAAGRPPPGRARGVAYRFAELAELLPEVEEIVATGHALLVSPEWVQLFADVLGRPVTASARCRGLGEGRRRLRPATARCRARGCTTGARVRAGSRARRDLRGCPRAAARPLPETLLGPDRRLDESLSGLGDVLRVDPGRSKQLGRLAGCRACRARRAARPAPASPRRRAPPSTASPSPPSGQWSSTVTIRPPVASAAARKVSRVDRLDRVEVDHPRRDALALELLGRLQRLVQRDPGARRSPRRRPRAATRAPPIWNSSSGAVERPASPRASCAGRRSRRAPPSRATSFAVWFASQG